MCHHVSTQVPPEPASVRGARDFCRSALTGWHLSDLMDTAQVVVSELVTNGVLHAGSALTLTLSVASDHLEVAVSDASSERPQVRPHRQDLHADLDQLMPTFGQHRDDDRAPRFHVGDAGAVVGGRGLLLVEALAADWGVEPSDAGKAVWARLPASGPRRGATDCPCGAAGSGCRLASGHWVTEHGGADAAHF